MVIADWWDRKQLGIRLRCERIQLVRQLDEAWQDWAKALNQYLDSLDEPQSVQDSIAAKIDDFARKRNSIQSQINDIDAQLDSLEKRFVV